MTGRLSRHLRGIADPHQRDRITTVGDRLFERPAQPPEDHDGIHLAAIDQPPGI